VESLVGGDQIRSSALYEPGKSERADCANCAEERGLIARFGQNAGFSANLKSGEFSEGYTFPDVKSKAAEMLCELRD
jgi:hypothetical protein